MTTITGIDLGTTYSAIASLNGIGRPDIVPNAEGERITPSAIFFDQDDNGSVRVGVEAVNSRQINPDRAVRWIKRHIGSDYKVAIDQREWTPVELSSLILKKLAQDASGPDNEVKDVAISVPAHFDEVRRKATMDAGALAGLNVISIVNEPVAAALYYATQSNVTGRILVYDLGGGTFDVTVMDINGHDMDIICSQGDHALGGIDFDKKIVEMFEAAYREKCGEELIDSDESRAKYEDEAEDVKKTLSRRDSAKRILYGPNGTARIEITREMFEEAIAPLIARTEMLIETALGEADSQPKDIDKVLLVGGSTRMPIVVNKLQETFGFEIDTAVNVDECVALGAALHAGLAMMRENPQEVSAGITGGLQDVNLQDVCNHSYGTLCAPIDENTGQRVVQNSKILQKNTPLPCQESRTFYTMYDNQDCIRISITQGEDDDPSFVNVLAQEVFELSPDCQAGNAINATYSYDLNQRMHCSFVDGDSGKTLDVEFDLGQNGELSKVNMENQVQEMAGFDVK